MRLICPWICLLPGGTTYPLAHMKMVWTYANCPVLAVAVPRFGIKYMRHGTHT